jgi:predicted membrane GTPase involved in stress response
MGLLLAVELSIYALCVQVITREVDGKKMEPYEEAVVEVPETYVGSVVELFAQRKGEMVDMQPSVQVRTVWEGGLGARHVGLTPTKPVFFHIVVELFAWCKGEVVDRQPSIEVSQTQLEIYIIIIVIIRNIHNTCI